MDHLRGQLSLVEQTNAQLSVQVAALSEELGKLRCSDKMPNGSAVVIKQERRDSADSDSTLDGSTSPASEGATTPASGDSGKSSDPPPPRPVATT